MSFIMNQRNEKQWQNCHNVSVRFDRDEIIALDEGVGYA
jgi:hypothetical protein